MQPGHADVPREPLSSFSDDMPSTWRVGGGTAVDNTSADSHISADREGVHNTSESSIERFRELENGTKLNLITESEYYVLEYKRKMLIDSI